MDLSARERHLLRSIEHDLAATDPALDNALRTFRFPTRSRRLGASRGVAERAYALMLGGMFAAVVAWVVLVLALAGPLEGGPCQAGPATAAGVAAASASPDGPVEPAGADPCVSQLAP